MVVNNITVLAKIHFDKGLTYKEIALYCGLSRRYITDIANGISPITPWCIRVISRVWPEYLEQAKTEYMNFYITRLNNAVKGTIKDALCH